MILIATRIYPLNTVDGTEYEARDPMFRKDDGGFELHRTTNGMPGEPDSVSAYSLAEVHEWLLDCPWQIVSGLSTDRLGRCLLLIEQQTHVGHRAMSALCQGGSAAGCFLCGINEPLAASLTKPRRGI